jgi:cholesterol oxidase
MGDRDWGTGQFDYDWVVVGSGFGGGVSALRLSERGYRVTAASPGRAAAGGALEKGDPR